MKNQELALRRSKKIKLQNRLSGERKRRALTDLLQKEVVFLDIETSLAVRTEIQSRHILRPSPHNGYIRARIEHAFDAYIQKMETILKAFDGQGGFCFTYDWALTGVALLNTTDLCTDLNRFMFEQNDEFSFFTSDLNKAVIFSGDRTGSGDKLNDLSVSVLGADWLRLWKDGGGMV